MKMRWAWMLPVLSVLTLLVPRAALSQGYPQGQAGYPGPMPMMAPGQYPGMPAGYMAGPGGQPGLLPDAYGAYGAGPTGAPDGGGGASMGPDLMMGGGGGGCPYCGGMGCDVCGGGHGHGGHGLGNGLLGDVFGLVAPYPDGGCAAVRWYDFAVDALYMRREDAGDRVDFTSLGINGPIVLSSDDFDFDNEYGFRFSAMFQWGAGSNVEFTYMGTVFHDDSAFVADPNDGLFSAFSNFGLLPFQGFAETDQSDFQSIDYESQFHSFEVNFRQRWMAPNCRYQGSYLVGARYFQLDEDFNYFTQSTVGGDPGPPVVPATMLNNINVHNSLTGIQAGGDLWICILPGLRLGGELKGGVFGLHAAIENSTTVNVAGVEPFVEDLTANDVAFIAQADILATYRLNYQWTLRAGYQFLFVEGVALAPENFNPTPPAIFSPAPAENRVAEANDDGNVFYHGFFAGAEFMW